MSRLQHRHTAWQWFKEELARQLGQEACDRVFAEYSARAKADKRYNDRIDAPALIARLEERYWSGRALEAERQRLLKRIARLRALLEQPAPE